MHQAYLTAGAELARDLSTKGFSRDEAVVLTSRAIRNMNYNVGAAGMGSPALVPGTPFLVASSALGTLGWLVYLLKG